MRAWSWLSVVILVGATLSARSAHATAGIAEWTIQTPGGHIIAYSDAWQSEHGIGLGTELQEEPLVRNLRRWRYYPDAVIGQTDQGYFLFREKSGRLARYSGEQALAAALKGQHLGAALSDWYEPKHGWEEQWFPILFFKKCRSDDAGPAASMKPLCDRFLSPKGLTLQRLVTWGHACAQLAAAPASARTESAEQQIDAYCKLLREASSPPQRNSWQPHAANPVHPPEVARIMKLLPRITTGASVDELIALLGLPKKWDGGDVSATGCTMIWNFEGDYKFVLSFDPVPKKGKLNLEFREAAFSAPNKPGFPPEEGHTVFPYRTWKGMVYK